jgi:hypothetical protein
MQTPIIFLAPSCLFPDADQTPQPLVLWYETEEAWYGRALSPRHAPAMAWPKQSWRLVAEPPSGAQAEHAGTSCATKKPTNGTGGARQPGVV